MASALELTARGQTAVGQTREGHARGFFHSEQQERDEVHCPVKTSPPGCLYFKYNLISIKLDSEMTLVTL